ncbi:MAG: Succinyl-diaminopimelate desuccinylase [Chlamydiia bacterium]|nr:Succinyl-diaminopimelate desuccinylase [Chlamydiia bacterium]MCH9618855.1 Succinyl-diaminopimelate desuccinylase [Chlamydiia bacterium]MCH9624544.1 Succinyl-diaminopimelate desuccinylase [Chlamydiia bacterium]
MFYKEWFEQREEQIWKDFFTYLSIPSISADKEYKGDVLRAAAFVEQRLNNLGMNVSRLEDLDTPILFAERAIDPSYSTVLIYGHYDVQPVDPIELWDSDPFKPETRDGKIYARGAEDNKGQNFYAMLAVEAFYAKHKDPKVNIKIIIEGAEEIGSPGFEKVAKKYADKLKADSIWIVDMGIESYNIPVLSLGVRGITGLEVTVSNSEFDLHSGSYGGAVYNPIQALCEMMAAAFDEKGHIAIDGFYDTIHPLTDEEKSSLYLATDQKTYEKETGATCFRKEEGYSLQESICIRPTFEINGIYGGYQKEGGKTIIPKEATAKITCRLVAGQDPEDIAKKVEAHLRKVAPSGIVVSISLEGGGESAWARPSDYSARVFVQILKEITGKQVKFCYSGGSIPLTAVLGKAAGGECIFLGTALPEDRIHAPNENFSKKQFIDGYHMIAKGLEVFAQNKNLW